MTGLRAQDRERKISAMQRRIDEALASGVSDRSMSDILTDARSLAGSVKELRRTLKSELKRTGMTVIALLKDADDLPDGVNVRAVNRWIGGLEQPERQSQFDFVLRKLRALPDAPTGPRGHVTGRPGRRHPRAGEEWIEVTAEMRAQLDAEFIRTGMRFDTVLKDVADVPEGLTARILRGWLYDHAKSTRAAHWEFVLHRLMAAPDGGPLPPLTRTRHPKADA